MAGTVQIKLNNGNIATVKEGSALHNTYKNSVISNPVSQQQATQTNQANNQARQQQTQQQYQTIQPQQTQQQAPQQSYQSSTPSYQSTQPTYETTPTFQNSGNVKSADFSVSGYQVNNAPSFTASQNTQSLLQQLRDKETYANDVFNNYNTYNAQGVNYNSVFGERNTLSGQLLNSILQDSGGNASLADIESILGRRLENQELDAYRGGFTQGELQQSQLNNLFEHDFATRNNGEHNQYVTNYLNGDTNAPLAESLKQYIDGLSGDARTQYAQSINGGITGAQDYFAKRATGYTPEYVNNTINPLPYGPVDASDVISGGGAKLADARNFYETYGVSPYDSNADTVYQQYVQQQQQQQAQLQALLQQQQEQQAYQQQQVVSQGGGQNSPAPAIVAPPVSKTETPLGNAYAPGSSSNTPGYVDRQVINQDTFTNYLNSILKGGF